MGPPDPIIGLNEAYAKDDFPQKVNIGVGAYRNDNGKAYVLPCVMEAERRIMSMLDDGKLDHEYAGITGDSKFVECALNFAYGEDSSVLKEKKVAAVQSLSGTGGLRVFGEFIKKFGHSHIYLPDPTWGNHGKIFQDSGLEVRTYRYYDRTKSDLNFEGMKNDINDAPAGSVVLLHACAHNPTGMDPSLDQWAELSQIMKNKGLFPFFDCAYQGFASGNAHKDASAFRMFVNDGHHLALVQSFSKNFGLYGQRVGALSFVADDPDEASRILSQLKICIRPSYSNPPRHGSRIVSTVLSDEKLTKDFIDQCKDMADRINSMRVRLRTILEDAGSERNWEHITKQIGMFAYSGLSKEEVIALRDEHHIYCTLDGRMSMAGMGTNNVDYIGNAIHEVTK